MARRILHQLVDDIDGTVLEVGEGETVHFSLGGVSYEIDLTDENASALRAAFEPYISAARRATGSGAARSSAPRKRAGRDSEATVIREWAQANGYTVSDRGRVAASIVEAYRAAH